ncbi:flagellar protein FlgN [Desulfovibrio sp. OttesenSCG-928-C14]|nr:flagellar protein FlgN [Desulfovibrio sp. OttesenSCG-928-C14]
MFAQILGNLTRQAKGLELLASLQQEEYELLHQRNTSAIGALEFSIHELLRQLAVERDELKSVMQGTRLAEYAGMLPEEDGAQVLDRLASIDALEQNCARQAEKNTELSLALLDKSHEVMNYLYEQIQPRQHNVYGSKGNMSSVRKPGASILSGRL